MITREARTEARERDREVGSEGKFSGCVWIMSAGQCFSGWEGSELLRLEAGQRGWCISLLEHLLLLSRQGKGFQQETTP